jgi:hypothetical protein
VNELPLGWTLATVFVNGIPSAGVILNVSPLNTPPIARCRDVVKAADANCGAAVTAAEVDNGSSDPNGDPINLTLSPPGPYPLGTNTVTLMVTDSQGAFDTCSASVVVVDGEPPLVTCRPAPNPSGKNVPVPRKTTTTGVDPAGFYQLLATDNCDPAPAIFVADSASAFIAGPFASGDIVKITQSMDEQPFQNHSPRNVVAHIHLKGDALIYGVDSAGNAGMAVGCKTESSP